MPISAGKLRFRFLVQKPGPPDSWNAPSGDWETVGELRGDPRADSGVGAIRTGVAANSVLNVSRYSVQVRTAAVRHFAITDAFRLVLQGPGTVFSIRGVLEDITDTQQTFLLCEVNGDGG